MASKSPKKDKFVTPKRERPEVKETINSSTEAQECPIVAVGASAGGVEAFSELLRNFPQDAEMAFVLVQHLDPTHQSVLPEILGRVTKVPVLQVTDGMLVEARHVYVIPANTTMLISNGALHLGARVVTHGQHMPVDEFFLSLAEECGNRAIGVILSGMASDGTEGCRAIKAAGGITFAQSEETAKFTGMPSNAIRAGCIDFVMSPNVIAKELARISRHPYVRSARSDDEASEALVVRPNDLDKILQLLRENSGVDFTQYKKSTLQRRIGRRMVVHHLEQLHEYLQFIQENSEELDELYRDILIHVTEFFRDSEAFDALREHVFPRLLKNRKLDANPVRIWVPGCSTGEEVYSIAIALLEYMWESRSVPQGSITTSAVQIFGTDISEHALTRARSGLYPQSALSQVSPERLNRFFVKLDGGYQINKSLREMCIFAKQDVTRDPPFSNLDLISCRNVLIYLGPTLQKRVIPTFHYALKHDGFLLLGGSESLGTFAEHFSLIDKKQRIYQKIGSATRLLSYFVGPGAGTIRRLEEPAIARPSGSATESDKEIERTLVQHYAPTSIVVNSQMEIVQFRGRTGAYLEPPEGQPSSSLVKMAREGLLVDLRRAIERAKKENTPVHVEDVQVKSNGGTRGVNIDVIPIRGHVVNDRFYVVAFHDAHSREKNKPSKPGKAKLSPKQAEVGRENERLKREIASMKEQMRTLIEENESTTEEYKSANEEVLSANEELQSTNEELETAKEELQSSNEELTTLNEELQNRNIELSLANNDLTNLLGNVNIPVVMIGNDLRIRRFTPPAQKLLNLLPGDIGRRLGEIRPNIDFDQLEELARDAIDNTSLQEREVREKEAQHWHLLRVRPYKTWDNKIDDAVISLQDIHALKATAEQSRTYADALIETSRESILILDTNLRVTVANPAFYRTFGLSPADTEGHLIYRLSDGQWDLPELRKLFEKLIATGAAIQDFELRHHFLSSRSRTLLINARRTDLHPGEGVIVVTVDDVTETRKNAEEILQQAALIELVHESVIVRDWDGKIRSWNRGAEELYGWQANEAKGKIIHQLLQTKFPKPLEQIKEELQRTDHWEGELVHARQDGEERIVSSRWAIQPRAGSTPLILEINVDVTDRVRSEKNLRDLSTYLMRIQDDERRRIARELHDSTGQKLAALKMNIESMKAAKGKANNPDFVSESIQLVDEASQEIRILAQLLHPPLLDEAGLVSAINWLVDGFTTRAKIPVNVKASPELGRLPDNVEIALFRIVQESLNNIYRHSGATKASIDLKRKDQTVELRITDNGNGMPDEVVSGDGKPALGVGILGMKERMTQLGGNLNIQSDKGGTSIVATVHIRDLAKQKVSK